MKTYGAVDVQIHVFLTSALVGSEWSASRPGRFIPGERATWIRGWVGPRTGLDDLEKRTFLPLSGLELLLLGRPAFSQSLYRLRYSGSQYILHSIIYTYSYLQCVVHICITFVFLLSKCSQCVVNGAIQRDRNMDNDFDSV
jgi:hypothetical protein